MVGCERDEIRSFGHPAEQLALWDVRRAQHVRVARADLSRCHHLIGAPVQLRDVSMCSENCSTPNSQVPSPSHSQLPTYLISGSDRCHQFFVFLTERVFWHRCQITRPSDSSSRDPQQIIEEQAREIERLREDLRRSEAERRRLRRDNEAER